MSELARELVQQALDQDYNGANKIFDNIMGVKINDALEQEKIRLANGIYNEIEDDDDMGDEDDLVGDEDGSDDQYELDLEAEGESEQDGEVEEEELESEDDEEEEAFDSEEVEEES
tara:strand:+ start:116 stop:463 length:348 start_codon:yes stop_codon:yes gene_type:complete